MTFAFYLCDICVFLLACEHLIKCHSLRPLLCVYNSAIRPLKDNVYCGVYTASQEKLFSAQSNTATYIEDVTEKNYADFVGNFALFSPER